MTTVKAIGLTNFCRAPKEIAPNYCTQNPCIPHVNTADTSYYCTVTGTLEY